MKLGSIAKLLLTTFGRPPLNSITSAALEFKLKYYMGRWQGGYSPCFCNANKLSHHCCDNYKMHTEKRLSHFATTSSSYFAMIKLDFRRLSLGRTAKWIQWLPELLRSM